RGDPWLPGGAGAVRRLAAPGRGAGGVRGRAADRKLLAHPEDGRRPHRAAPGGGDLRGDGRRDPVRLPGHADRTALRRDRQRAAALRRGALHPQQAVRRRQCRDPGRAGHPVQVPPGAGAGVKPDWPCRPAEPPQLPLALRYPAHQRLETFVAAPEGVVGHLRALARGEGASAYVAGAGGTGKTHLLLATCALVHESGRRAAYLPLASAAGRLRDALEALEGNDLVALDGLETVAGERADELALFDAHNRAAAAGTQLLYAARCNPDALPPGLQIGRAAGRGG